MNEGQQAPAPNPELEEFTPETRSDLSDVLKPEGLQLVEQIKGIDLMQALQVSKEFYERNGLANLSQGLPDTLLMSPAEIERMEALIKKHGFNAAQVFPASELLQAALPEILKLTTGQQHNKSLTTTDQYRDPGYFLWEEIDKKRESLSHDREGQRPYIKLIKEVGKEDQLTTKKTNIPNKHLDQGAESPWRQESDLQWGTLPEYMLEQWKHLEAHKKHIDDPDQMSLLPGTTFEDSEGRRRVARCFWYIGARQVYVTYVFSDAEINPRQGAVPCGIFYLANK